MGHKDRTCKGRVVFGGDDVRTQNREVAVFQDMASQPATMEASCTSDAYGTMAGNATEQADAEQAYAEAMFLGTPTFLRLPKHQWPEAWRQKGYIDPVVPMKLALYGHPDSGAYWEQKADKD